MRSLRRRYGHAQGKLARRAFRLARTAVVLRQRGNVDRAMQYERTIDHLLDTAEARGGAVARAVDRAVEHGQRAGHRLYHKARKH